jgi:phage terminase large subunit-like protein
VWLQRAGRGAGKTRSGAEWVRDAVERRGLRRIALVGQTKADVRDTMIEIGDSSLLSCCPPWFRPTYEVSKRRVTWPNGAIAVAYSGDEPDQLRGPQHDAAWVDELAKMKYPQETWDNLQLGLRLGAHPQCVVTTTPRPIEILKSIIGDPDTVETRVSTYANRANLAPKFLAYIERKYAGTRLGRQELDGELLDDVLGALWTRGLIDRYRVKAVSRDTFVRVAVAIDPAVTSGEDADETGIVAVGLAEDGHAYVLEDRTLRGKPAEWAGAALGLAADWSADVIVAEANQGGEMVAHTIWTAAPYAPVTLVHASRGKRTRAEPISMLYEQGRVHHVGMLAALEDEMCTWVPGDDALRSPDRMDALVWALSKLFYEPDEGDAGQVTYDDPVSIAAY